MLLKQASVRSVAQ